MMIDGNNPGASASADDAGTSLPQTGISATTPQPPTAPYILIFDDDTGVVTMLTELLEAQGWRTIGMRSGMAAWTFLKNVRLIPSLILLDVMMPDMLGSEFVIYQRVDNELERIPVALMSGDVNLQQLPPGLEVVAFLPKPFDIARLFELCAKYCRRTNCPAGVPADG